jgi:(p)ppGpp synthase/HD superfamily hydrolase
MKENLRGNQEIAILKCCDRSHNIRTLEFFEEEKLKRYIEETFGYIEIIHKLGLKELTYNLTERIYIFLHDIKQNPKLITDISYVVRELKIPDDLKEIIFGIDKEVQT